MSPASPVLQGLNVLGGPPYTIQSGDQLVWRQLQSATTKGGVQIQTSSGSGPVTLQQVADYEGISASADTITGSWHNRVVDSSGLAGQTLAQVSIGVGQTSTGSVYLGVADMVLVSPASAAEANLITPGQSAPLLTALSGNTLPSGTLINTATTTLNGSTTAATHFFVGDQVGTAQMEFAGGGWPIWRGEFTPFGSPVNNNITTNNYKFTGQERDSESADFTNTGLDFMNARYYSSILGRFTSPDPDLGSIDPTNPQSLNRYSYALNRPLSLLDPSGRDPVCFDNQGRQVDVELSDADNANFDCQVAGGSVVAYDHEVSNPNYDPENPVDGLLPTKWVPYTHDQASGAAPVDNISIQTITALDPDNQKLMALGQGVNRGAWAVGNPKTYLCLAAATTAGAAIGVAVLNLEALIAVAETASTAFNGLIDVLNDSFFTGGSQTLKLASRLVPMYPTTQSLMKGGVAAVGLVAGYAATKGAQWCNKP